MQQIKSVVFTFCLASLCAGVLLHLFPDAAAKRCMKAVAGLYVLAAILHGMQDATFAFVNVAQYAKAATVPALLSAPKDGLNGFEANLLAQAEENLNQRYSDYFSSIGYDVTMDIQLTATNESVAVQGVTVIANTSLSTQAQAEISAYLCEMLALDTVTFL